LEYDELLLVESSLHDGELAVDGMQSMQLSLMHYVEVDTVKGQVEVGSKEAAVLLDFDEAYGLMRLLQEILPHPCENRE
jgi:hypothetical protein